MEKRKHKRHQKRLFSRFGDAQSKNVGFTEDVSLEGLFIKTNAVLTSGTDIVIEVTLPDNRVVRLHGQVKWAKYAPPALMRHVKKTGFGVQLKESREEFHQLVQALECSDTVQSAPESVANSEGAPPSVGNTVQSEPEALSTQEIHTLKQRGE